MNFESNSKEFHLYSGKNLNARLIKKFYIPALGVCILIQFKRNGKWKTMAWEYRRNIYKATIEWIAEYMYSKANRSYLYEKYHNKVC